MAFKKYMLKILQLAHFMLAQCVFTENRIVGTAGLFFSHYFS